MTYWKRHRVNMMVFYSDRGDADKNQYSLHDLKNWKSESFSCESSSENKKKSVVYLWMGPEQLTQCIWISGDMGFWDTDQFSMSTILERCLELLCLDQVMTNKQTRKEYHDHTRIWPIEPINH